MQRPIELAFFFAVLELLCGCAASWPKLLPHQHTTVPVPSQPRPRGSPHPQPLFIRPTDRTTLHDSDASRLAFAGVSHNSCVHARLPCRAIAHRRCDCVSLSAYSVLVYRTAMRPVRAVAAMVHSVILYNTLLKRMWLLRVGRLATVPPVCCCACSRICFSDGLIDSTVHTFMWYGFCAGVNNDRTRI